MNLQRSLPKLCADRGAEDGGEGLAEALYVGIVFGFDHDTCQRFGARVTQNDAAVFAERGLRFGKGAGNFGKRFERRFRTDFDVEDGLGIILESFDQGFEAAVQRDE